MPAPTIQPGTYSSTGHNALAAYVDDTRAGVIARKATNEPLPTLSTTLQNDDDLFWAVEASTNYAYDLFLFYTATSATPDLKIGWTGPSGTTMNWGGIHLTTASALTVISGLTIASTVPIGADTPSWFAHFHGVVAVSTTPGTLQFQAAQNTSDAATVTVLAGSRGTLTQVT